MVSLLFCIILSPFQISDWVAADQPDFVVIPAEEPHVAVAGKALLIGDRNGHLKFFSSWGPTMAVPEWTLPLGAPITQVALSREGHLGAVIAGEDLFLFHPRQGRIPAWKKKWPQPAKLALSDSALVLWGEWGMSFIDPDQAVTLWQQEEPIRQLKLSTLGLPVIQTANNLVALFDLTGKGRLEHKQDEPIVSFDISADGSVFALNGSDRRLRLRIERSVPWQKEFADKVVAQALSPNGGLVATGLSSGSLLVLDGESGTRLWSAELGATIAALAFSPDGRNLVGISEKGHLATFLTEGIAVWSLDSTLRPKDVQTTDFGFVVATSNSVAAFQWNRAPAQWRTVVHPDHWINWTSLSGDGSVLVTGDFRFNTMDDFVVTAFGSDGSTKGSDRLEKVWQGGFWYDVSHDGSIAVAAGNSKEEKADGGGEAFIRAYRVAPFKKILSYLEPGVSRFSAVTLSGDGTTLAAAGRNCLGLVFTRKDEQFSLVTRFQESDDELYTVSMSHNGGWIAFGSAKHGDPNDPQRKQNRGPGRVFLLENSTGTFEKRAAWSAPKEYRNHWVQSVKMTPDGQWLVAALSNGKLWAFYIPEFSRTGQPAWCYDTGQTQNLYGVSIADDGRTIATGRNLPSTDQGGYVYLIENQSIPSQGSTAFQPKLLWKAKTARSPNPGIALDASGHFLVAADGYPLGTPSNFYLWHRSSANPLWTYATRDMNWPITISSDARYIAGGGDDGVIYFFNHSTKVTKP